MDLLETFQMTAGSTPGRLHRIGNNMRNNQDAVRVIGTDAQILGFVSDGCSSQPYSEFGVRLTVNLMPKIVRKRLARRRPSLNEKGFKQIYDQLVRRLVATAKRDLDEATLTDALNQYMMATAGGMIMLPDTTYFYGGGDFVVIVNGEVHVWQGEKRHEAPYPVLSLQFPGDPRFCFRRLEVPTAEIDTFMFGTDGVEQLVAVCGDKDSLIPGTDDPVGPIDQIWTNDKFYANPGADPVGTWLNRLAANNRAEGPFGPMQHGGLLDDDTTFFAGRR